MSAPANLLREAINAIRLGNEAGLKKLAECLQLGLDPNQPDAEGNTLLHHADRLKRPGPFVGVLFSHEAEPSILNNEGNPPLYASHFIKILSSLYEISSSESQLSVLDDHNTLDAIYLTAQKGVEALSKTFSSQMLNCVYPSNRGPVSSCTPLADALIRGEIEVVRSLLAAGADPNHASHFWENPIRRLIESKADPHLYPIQTPLKRAVAKKSLPLVALLLQHGADPNQTDDFNTSSPLQDCLSTAHFPPDLEIAKSLLGAKARVSATPDGRNIPLHTASLFGFHEIIRDLIGDGIAVDHPDKNGNTALMIACGSNQNYHQYDKNKTHFQSLLTAEALIQQGADIHYTQKNNTPLIIAALQEKMSLVALLLAKGVDLNRRSKEAGKTVLHALHAQGINDRNGIRALLLVLGARYDIPDNRGVTALSETSFHSLNVLQLFPYLRAWFNRPLLQALARAFKEDFQKRFGKAPDPRAFAEGSPIELHMRQFWQQNSQTFFKNHKKALAKALKALKATLPDKFSENNYFQFTPDKMNALLNEVLPCVMLGLVYIEEFTHTPKASVSVSGAGERKVFSEREKTFDDSKEREQTHQAPPVGSSDKDQKRRGGMEAVDLRGEEKDQKRRGVTAAVNLRRGEKDQKRHEETTAVDLRRGEKDQKRHEETTAVDLRRGEKDQKRRGETAAFGLRDGETEAIDFQTPVVFHSPAMTSKSSLGAPFLPLMWGKVKVHVGSFPSQSTLERYRPKSRS